MASLLDPLPEDTIRLLRVTADGYAASGGHWPCWQWVRQQLWTQHGLDAQEILGGMPTWEYDYRPVRLGYRGQPVPKVADEVPLSIHGMAYVCPAVLAVQRLVDAFLAVLKTAIVMQRGINPRPTEPVQLKVPGDDFTRTVNMATDTELSSDQLFALLGGEPATWLGIGQQNGQWTWDLTDARLSPYAEVTTVDDYLVKLDALVALPQQPAVPDSLPALALPEAFDHLDLAWRIATGKHLFRVPRAAVPAKLTQPATSAEEFESRCSALADMLLRTCRRGLQMVLRLLACNAEHWLSNQLRQLRWVAGSSAVPRWWMRLAFRRPPKPALRGGDPHRVRVGHQGRRPHPGAVWQSAVMNHARRLDWRQWLAATRHPARKDGAIAVALIVPPWVIALVLWLLWLRRQHLDAGTAAAVIFGFAAVSVGLPVVWLAWVPIRNASRSSVPSAGDRVPGPAVPAWAPTGRPLAEVTDPFALEVHRPVQPEDPPPGLPVLPAYVPREHDTALGSVVRAAAAGRNGMAVLVGGSSTGKTRACWEALRLLRDQPGPWRLWHPIDPTRPDAALRELSGIGTRTVVWLNEAQFYLDVPDGGLGDPSAGGPVSRL